MSCWVNKVHFHPAGGQANKSTWLRFKDLGCPCWWDPIAAAESLFLHDLSRTWKKVSLENGSKYPSLHIYIIFDGYLYVFWFHTHNSVRIKVGFSVCATVNAFGWRKPAYCSFPHAVSHLNSTGFQCADTPVNPECQLESAAWLGSDHGGTAAADGAQHGAEIPPSPLPSSGFCMCVHVRVRRTSAISHLPSTSIGKR